MDLAGLLLPALNVTSADIALTGYGNELVFDRDFLENVRAINGVATAYGCSYTEDVPAASSNSKIDHVNMVSYDNALLAYSKRNVVEGNLEDIYGDSSKVATVFNKENPLKIGDTIQIAGKEVEVSCVLSQGLFGDGLIVICSQETFEHLTGIENYCLIGIQLSQSATEKTVAQIRSFENDKIVVDDQRTSNQQDIATYWATRIVGYGFLLIIGMITLLNIINSISMSVSARTKQYGAMRAAGMDNKQLTRMIFAEAFTYAISGLLVGCAMGISLSRWIYSKLITQHFGVTWHLPIGLLGIVILFIFASVLIAVYTPSRRMRNMEITETINDL